MDWLRRLLGGVGNAIGGAVHNVQNAVGGAAHQVQQAAQPVIRQAQQAPRQVQQVQRAVQPRLNLQSLINAVHTYNSSVPQMPRVDLGSIGRQIGNANQQAFNSFNKAAGNAAKYGVRQAIFPMLNASPKQQQEFNKTLTSIPNIRAQGLEQLYGALHPGQESRPITLGGVSHHLPILSEAMQGANEVQNNKFRTAQDVVGGTASAAKKMAVTGATYAPYFVGEGQILKVAPEAGLAAKAGVKLVNNFVPGAGAQVVSEIARGNRDAASIAKEAAMAGAFNVAPTVISPAISKGKELVGKEVKNIGGELASRGISGAKGNAKLANLTSYEGAPDRARVDFWKQYIEKNGVDSLPPLKLKKDSTNLAGVEDGKHRLQALQELGFNRAPVQNVDMPGGKIRVGGLVPDMSSNADNLAKPENIRNAEQAAIEAYQKTGSRKEYQKAYDAALSQPKGFIVSETRPNVPGGSKQVVRVTKGENGLVKTQTTEQPKMIAGQLSDYNIVKVTDNKDFNKAVKIVSKTDGIPKSEAKLKVQQMLENARMSSVDSVKPSITPADPIKVEGNVVKHPAMQEVLTEISKAQNQPRLESSLLANEIASEARRLGVTADKNFIARYEAGKITDPNEKELANLIKSKTESIFQRQQALDPNIQHHTNYIPHTYNEKQSVIDEAVAMLKKRTSASKERTFSSYEEAKSYGLTPKYQTVDQMLGSNVSELSRVEANRKVVDTGLRNGLFQTEATAERAPVIGYFSPGGEQIYAQKSVADKLNGINQHDSNALSKIIHNLGKISAKVQDVMLQGGIPGTNFNFFVFGQGVKDTSRNLGNSILHPVRAVKEERNLIGSIFRGTKATQERFAKNTDFLRAMSERGLDIVPQSSMSGINKGKLEKGWDWLGNDPTFGRYMPNRTLDIAQEAYAQSVGKIGEEAALDLAAKATKVYQGHVDQILKGRTHSVEDALNAVAFAHKYRESIINALYNVVKSVYPSNWNDPAFAPSRQLLAGMAISLAGYEALNRQITGHSMMENRPGQELSLEIPYGGKDEKGNQKVINIPFMPGFMTLPRAAFNAGQDILKGDVQGVIGEASKGLSAPLQTLGNVVGNQDYFGRPIYVDQKTADNEGVSPDNPLQAGLKIAKYIGGQFSPAWIRAGIDAASGKPLEQNIATAVEAPVRFGKRLNPATQAYFSDRDQVYNSLDKNGKAAWDTIHPKLKNINGEYMVDKTVDSGASRALIYLDHPEVLAAENEMARRAAARGEKVDPLFTLPGEQQRIALRLSTLPPGDPQAKVMKMDNPWYRGFSQARSAFYDSLPPGDPNKPKNPIAYPEPSADVETKLNAYYQLKDSKMKAQFLKDNPEVTDQFAKQEQYTRAVRAAKNLPQYDQYPQASPAVQKLIDNYMSLPKGEANGKSKVRSAWIKSHPNEWAAMTDQFNKTAQFNLEQDAQIASFEGHDFTDKGIKAIASLGGGSAGGSKYAKGSGKAKIARAKVPKVKLTTKKISSPRTASMRAPKLTTSKVRYIAPKSSKVKFVA